MSREYRVDIYIEDELDDLKDEIVQDIFRHVGTTTLTGGQSESEYAEEVMQDIWEKTGRFVQIDVTMTYIEELPQTTYDGNQETYEELMEKYE